MLAAMSMPWVRGLPRELARTAAAVLDLVLPRVCPGCFTPGSWCDACAETIAGRPRSVAPPDTMLDRFAAAGVTLPALHALTRYAGPIRAAIVAGKERGRRDLPPLLGAALGRGIAVLQEAGVLGAELWLVPAPTRPAAARARGGDPVTIMARHAARLLADRGRPTGVAPCLYLARGTRDSVGLTAAGRDANLARAVRFRPSGAPPAGASIVLLDDVLTSGATATRSCLALARRGFSPTGVLVLASVPGFRPAAGTRTGATGSGNGP